jgi:hypothetical protein
MAAEMKMFKRGFLIGNAALFLSSVSAAQEKRPTAREVIARIQEHGGVRALDKNVRQ